MGFALVIDEISMVRADLMSAIDLSLRLNRGIDEPFGGVRVIVVGDLAQLPPVVQGEVAASAVPGATEPVNLAFDTRLLPAGQMEGLLDAVGEVPDPWTVLSVGITEGRNAAYLAIPGDDREPSAEDIARVEEGGLALTRYVDSYFLNGFDHRRQYRPG